MKPKQLQAFVTVAEQTSIRGAARTLGISQPAVTRTIRELERELGVSLVERGVGGVRLTVYGSAFLPRARLLLEDMRHAREELVQIRDGATGKVAVAVSTSFALTLMPAVFRDFHARWPRVDMQFSEGVLPWMLSQLRGGHVDLAVAHVMPGTLDPQFEATELFPVRLAVGVRSRHPLRRARSIRELHGAEWILPGEDEMGRESVAPFFAPLGLTPPARVVQGHSVTVALELVGQTDLVGLFVEPLAQIAFRRHGICRVELDEPLPMLSVCVLRRRGRLLTPAAQHFVDCVQRAVPQG